MGARRFWLSPRAFSPKPQVNSMSERNAKRTIGWMGIQRGHNAHPLEWIVEKGIMAISFSAIVMMKNDSMKKPDMMKSNSMKSAEMMKKN